MKKYAADNLMFLRQSYPEIYKLVRNKTYDGGNLRISSSKNGQANLTIIGGIREHTLYSRYNPKLEAEKWVETLDDTVNQADHLLICGFGFGYHIEALLKAYPNKRIYIYEPRVEHFLAAIEACDLRPVLKNRQIAMFAIGDDEIIQIDMIRNIYRSINGSFAVAVIPVYRRLYPDLINQLTANVQHEASNFRMTLLTLSKVQQEWAENIVINVKHNLRSYSFSHVRGVCEGIPAIVVGSGPSLDMEIDWLRKLQNRAIIIAAGSSAQALIKQGIDPHLIVSMDPNEANYRVFEKIDISNSPFLYIPTIKYTILDQNQDHHYRMHAFFNIDAISAYLMDLNEDDPIFLSTPTVTGTAIQAAIYLGCNEIVFIGQDFSYPNDRFYAEGIEHFSKELLETRVRDADLTVKNVSGGYNRTHANMLSLKSSVEELMKRLSYDAYYNASRVGAYIENTQPKTLEQLANQYTNNSYSVEWFKDKIKSCASHYSEVRIKKVIQNVKATCDSLTKLMGKLESLENHLEQSFKQNTTKQLERWFDRFDKIWRGMINTTVFSNIYVFLLQREWNYMERLWEDLKHEVDLFTKLEMLRECIKPLIRGMHTITPILIRSFEELRSSIEKECKE